MQEKHEEQSKRITAHNAKIRRLRNQGILRPLGTITRQYKPYMEAYKTFEGSIMPNKYLFWDLNNAIKFSYKSGGEPISREKEALDKVLKACLDNSDEKC